MTMNNCGYPLEVIDQKCVDFDITDHVEYIGGGDPYEGPTEVTPGETAQTLPTAGAIPDVDIVVKAIPSNYGKIGWDGSKMTVS